MELTINAQACDLAGSYVVPGYHAAKTADIDAAREGRSLKIILPSTPRNDAIMAFAGDLHASVPFNDSLHTAELSAEGAVLLRGTIRLLATSDKGYHLEIRDGGARWAANAARRMFNTLGIEYGEDLTSMTILRSWTGSSPVKFFPVHRDEYAQQNSSTDLLPAERLLTVDDYHPFLHIATLVGTIFSEAGYRIQSRFLESDFFRSLYLSGAYASRDTTAAANRMGFFARRLKPVTAEANFSGRVYANPHLYSNTVGNIVETATPQSIDIDQEPVPELHNNGGCFAIKNQCIVFTPPMEVSIGFEYYLKYTTDHRILSRTRLKGFDSLNLGTGSQMQFALANRYEDRRAEITPDFSYRIVVFDHNQDAQYRLTFTLNGLPGAVWTEFSARSAQVTTPLASRVADPVLMVRNGLAWVPYTGDWALYDGFITETGQTTVELRVRTASERLSPESPSRFDRIFFSGAEEGMRLTLHKECSMRPRFLASPGFGTRIDFADVAQLRIRQAELLESLAHLFNLRFYTEEQTRTVRIEPADDLFGSGPEGDWRSKTDFSQPVLIEQLAPEVHERRTWCYQAGDGAVARFDAEAPAPLGAWTAVTESYAAKQGEQVIRNPLLRATLNSRGHYRSAPSALLMQIGDRDDAHQDGTDFKPRIVRYAGMHPLPANECWGFPWEQDSYPLAAFQFPGDSTESGFSLCFEDRDGVQGLHRFYDRQVAQEASRERITLSLRIAPHEFETLLAPGVGGPDILSVFRIDTGQGEVRATLLRIDDYDPEAVSVRCTFNRLPED